MKAKNTKSKKLKYILMVIGCILALWIVMGITDFILVRNYHKPLFCAGVDLADDGGSRRYVGPGYGFDIEGDFMPESTNPGITSYRGYLFGKEIVRGFWDEMIAGPAATMASGGNPSVTSPGSAAFTGTMKEPPTLTVICEGNNTEAMLGTYSWHYPNWDGTMTAIEADSIHPLQAKEYMEPLNLIPSYLSHIDPYAVYSQFDVAPDSVEVSYWDEECWGRTDASFEHKAISVNKTEDTDTNGNPLFVYSFQRSEETAIYIISAKWESYENFGGTAYYSFYTTYPLLEPQVIEP